MDYLFKQKNNIDDETRVLQYNQLKSLFLSDDYSNIHSFYDNQLTHLKVYDLYECVLLYGNEHGLNVLFSEFGEEQIYSNIDMISILVQSIKNKKNINMYEIIFRSFQKKPSYQNFVDILLVSSVELLDLFIYNFSNKEEDEEIEFNVPFLFHYVIKENNISYIYKLFETFHQFPFLKKHVLNSICGNSIQYNFINETYLLNSIRDTLIDKCSEVTISNMKSVQSSNMLI